MSAGAGTRRSAAGASAWRIDSLRWLGRQFAIERDARTALHLLPVGLMGGILLRFTADWRFDSWIVLAAGAVLVLVRVLRVPVLAFLAPCLAMILWGAAMADREIERTPTVILSGEATTRLTGRVLWRDRDERNRMRYLVEVTGTERPVLSRPPTRVKLLVSAKHAPLAVGQTFRGLVRLRPPSGPAIPGGYDFAFGAFFDGYGAHGFGLGPPDAVDGPTSDPPLLERLVRLRLAISDRIRSVLPGAEGAVASAIITGERSGIPDDVDEWLRATGLSHVLSISGLHMALVAGFTMTLVRVIGAAIPAVALRFPVKKIAAVAALCVATFYLLLSGMDVATLRSFVMIAIMLCAIILDRSAITLRNVSIAALVVLTLSPHALFTAGFQMSFAATLAIVSLYGIYAGRTGKGEPDEPDRSLVRRIAFGFIGMAVASLVAGLATAPYAAFHFQRTAPFGLVANMIVLPIFSFWIMPLALLSMIAMPFGIDAPILWLLGKGLGLVFTIARVLSSYLPNEPTGLVPNAALILLTAALMLGCLLASRLRLAALPVAAVAVGILARTSPPPILLVFEDGRQIATIDADGRPASMAKPDRFVFDQWARAYPAADIRRNRRENAFECRDIETEGQEARQGKSQPMRYCHATTRSGQRIVWTDDWRETGRACRESDIAIVARALRDDDCKNGAVLVTLRTLRRSGSLAFEAAGQGRLIARPSIADPQAPWSRHRLAPWPETFRRSD